MEVVEFENQKLVAPKKTRLECNEVVSHAAMDIPYEVVIEFETPTEAAQSLMEELNSGGAEDGQISDENLSMEEGVEKIDTSHIDVRQEVSEYENNESVFKALSVNMEWVLVAVLRLRCWWPKESVMHTLGESMIMNPCEECVILGLPRKCENWANGVDAVDTTRFGDAFDGGILSQLASDISLYQNEKRLAEALKFANPYGAVIVQERGAIPTLPGREDVLEALQILRSKITFFLPLFVCWIDHGNAGGGKFVYIIEQHPTIFYSIQEFVYINIFFVNCKRLSVEGK
eukprot:Gb_06360 [translate_table: standard]